MRESREAGNTPARDGAGAEASSGASTATSATTGAGRRSNSTLSALQTLNTFYQNINRVRLELDIEKQTRSSLATIKVLIFFDALYLIAGIALICVGLSGGYKNKDHLIVYGGVIGLLSSFTFTCNSLAVHGLRSWKRGFLIPWLVLWLFILAILIFNLIQSILFLPITSNYPGFRQALEVIFCFCVFSVWCNMRKQYSIMALSRDSQMNVDVERMTRDLFGRTNSSQNAPDPNKDLPPKYEDCTDLPPAYDVNTMIPNISASVQNGASVQNPVPAAAVVVNLPPAGAK